MSNGLNTFPTNRVTEEAAAASTGSGGTGFAFGLVPPKASETFREIRNTSPLKSGAGGTERVFKDKGFTVPVVDTEYAALQVTVRNDAGTNQIIGRGQQPDGTSEFGTLISAFPSPLDTFAGAYYYSTVNNSLYMLMSTNPDNSISGYPKGITKIPVDAAGGTPVILMEFDVDLTDGWTFTTTNNASSCWGNQIFPSDPLNPDTSDWSVIYAGTTGSDSSIVANPRIAVYSNAGGGVGTQQSLTTFTVNGGANDVIYEGGYVTRNKQIICTPFRRNLTSARDGNMVSFRLQRGSSNITVEVPADGVVPMVAADSGQLTRAMFCLWGEDTVVMIADNTVSSGSFVTVYGRRIWDRDDLDRWLNEVCDAHNMAAGEDFY